MSTRTLSSIMNNFSSTGHEADSRVQRSPSLRTRSVPAMTRSRQRSSDRLCSSSESESEQEMQYDIRGRSLDKETEHKLHEAVSSIKVTRSMSPEVERRKSPIEAPQAVVSPVRASHPAHESPAMLPLTKPLSSLNLGSKDLQKTGSCAVESDQDENLIRERPMRMARKKSGEWVRSSLKSGGRRPASMPSTPAYTKNVHFDRKLEHIRHFLHSEKPLAVSTQGSPNEEYATQSEFPWESSGRFANDLELSIDLPNFVPEAQQAANEGAIIKVETVYLSSDRRSLIGRVAVRNLAFEKYVSVRYTLDYWRTTSETAAAYTEDVRKKQRDDPFDRFLFNIKIDDFTGVIDKTMFFCVRYHTGGKEFWDSNGGQNFRVEFHKRPVAERRHSDPPVMAPLSRSDEIGTESGIQLNLRADALKSPRALIFENIYDDPPSRISDDVEHDKPVKTKSRVSQRPGAEGGAFSTRYDFGASLSAAIAAANSSLQGSEDEIRLKQRDSRTDGLSAERYNPYFAVTPDQLNEPLSVSSSPLPESTAQVSGSPVLSGEISPIPGVGVRSQSEKGPAYQTLLDNYCFVWQN